MQIEKRLFQKEQMHVESESGNLQLPADQQRLTDFEEQLDAKEQKILSLNHDLNERMKELDCLYGLSEIIEQPGISVDEILQKMVNIIPSAWQYPEITCVRLLVKGRQFTTPNFIHTPWKQTGDIKLNNEKIGVLEVYYLQQRPDSYEGPFLLEERKLINAISRKINSVIERDKAVKETNILKHQMEFVMGVTKTGLDIIDSEFNIRYVDSSRQKIYGDPKGKKCYEYFLGKNNACSGCGVVKAFETKSIGVYEEILSKENNRIVQITAIPFQNDEGEWLVAEMNVDITEHKRVEETLRENKEKFRALAENSPDRISCYDRQYRYTYANPTIEKITGIKVEDLLGKTHRDLKYPDELCVVIEEAIEKVFQTGEINRVNFHAFSGECFDWFLFPEFDYNGQVKAVMTSARNITELKKAEETLRESREQFRTLAENSPDVIMRFDRQYRHTYVNPSIERETGIKPKDFIGKTHEELRFPKELCKIFDDAIEKVFQTGQVNRIEFQLSSGIWIDWYLFPEMSQDGQIKAVMTTSRDITEYKRVEKTLREHKEQFRALAENTPDLIARFDRQHRHMYVSPSVEKQMGFKVEDILGKTHREIGYPNETCVVLEDAIEIVFQTGQINRINFQIPSGTWVDWFLVPELGENGEVKAVMSSARDITDRKQVEELLREKNDRLEVITKNVGVAVSLISKDYRTIWSNGVIKELYGEVDGKKCYQAYNHQDNICSWCGVREVFEKGKDKVITEALGYDTNGEPIWAELHVTPVKDKSGEITSALEVVIPITERKRTEENLKQAKMQAETANEAKSLFLANMSHEIRTPMNAIIGFSEVLGDEHLTEEQKEYATAISKSGRHLMVIINDILDFSKIEAGKLDIENAECSLEHILISIESMMNATAKERGLAFAVKKITPLPAYIYTDSTRLRQCLINLTNNAIKFTQKGHVYLMVSMENKNNRPYIRFDVEDTGIGIPTQKQEKLFKPFSQIDASTSRLYGGTGLGLAITKQLTKLLGGEITLSSEEGKGSVFSIVIPISLEATQQPLPDKYDNAAQRDKNNIKSEQAKFIGHVLVAEDARTNQILTKLLLNKMGLDVTIAADGQEAIQKVLSHKYDLILMDIQMPNVDGYEATKTIRKEGITTPIIALTANVMNKDKEKCIETGCNDYLPKPIDRKELLAKISKYLPSEDMALIAKAD
jgi:PAS domain S-box-containing protein